MNNFLFVNADPSRGGDLGNYWHYILGFFLPFAVWMLDNKRLINGKNLVIDSCNPIMDQHLSLYLNHFKINHEFRSFTAKDLQSKIIIKKSRKRLFFNKLLGFEKKILKNKAFLFTYYDFKYKKKCLILPRWDEYLEQYKDFPPLLKKKYELLKNDMFDFVGDYRLENVKPYLILKRSEWPKGIEQDKIRLARWFDGYGAGRRQLLGVEETEKEMNSMGFYTQIYEPGLFSLKEQICKFSNSRGIIGVRGAEFVNMLWMPKGSLAIMFESVEFKISPIQFQLAKCLNINLIILDHEGKSSPLLTFDKISKYLYNSNNH